MLTSKPARSLSAISGSINLIRSSCKLFVPFALLNLVVTPGRNLVLSDSSDDIPDKFLKYEESIYLYVEYVENIMLKRLVKFFRLTVNNFVSHR